MLPTTLIAATAILLCDPTVRHVCTQDECRTETIGFHVLLDFDRSTLAHCRETVHGCSIAKVAVDRTAASGAIEVDGKDLKFRLWPSMEYMDVQLAEKTTDISFGKCRPKP